MARENSNGHRSRMDGLLERNRKCLRHRGEAKVAGLNHERN